MRDIRVIEAEISKLQSELEDAKADASKKIAACHILSNLGWTWTRGEGWKKPKPKVKMFDPEEPCHIKAGDICQCAGFEADSFVYVRRVVGKEADVSRIKGRIGLHLDVDSRVIPMPLNRLRVASYERVRNHFNR